MPAFEWLFPELGFPTPSYPALFRQATSYTWRPRQRKVPLWWLEGARGDVFGTCLKCAAAALAGLVRTGQARGGIQGGIKLPRRPKGRPRREKARSGDAHAELRTLWFGGHEGKK